MKKTFFVALILLSFSCNKTTEKKISNNDVVVRNPYYDSKDLEQLKMKCIKHGDSIAFGDLVDYYFNYPSDTYELLPIALVMADKYNINNARVSIYCQMIMMGNNGKLKDSLFFNLSQTKKDFVVSYLIDGVKNHGAGCKYLLKKIKEGGYEFKGENKQIEKLLK